MSIKIIAHSKNLTEFEKLFAEAFFKAKEQGIDLNNLNADKLDNKEFNKILDEILDGKIYKPKRKTNDKLHTKKSKSKRRKRPKQPKRKK